MAEDSLLRLVPEVFQRCVPDSPALWALSAVADDLHAPVLEVLEAIDRVVDPFRAPDVLVPYLSRWVDLDWLTLPDAAGPVPGNSTGVPIARQRDLIANAADLSARRGTAAGLQRFLELATGVEGFEIEDGPGAFHLLVRVPAAASEQIPVIRRIVRGVKPAHVTDDVEVMPPLPVRPTEPPHSGATTEDTR